MILDWDVHHGNGTAEIFRDRKEVLFASIHQAGIFPGSGPLGDVGSGEGEGYTINLPVPAGSEGELWLSLLEHVVLPAAAAFAPQLVLISAGFDAHAADPLAGCRLRTESFAQMACHVRDAAADAGSAAGSGAWRVATNRARWRSACRRRSRPWGARVRRSRRPRRSR